jgi:hypothetical protein
MTPQINPFFAKSGFQYQLAWIYFSDCLLLIAFVFKVQNLIARSMLVYFNYWSSSLEKLLFSKPTGLSYFIHLSYIYILKNLYLTSGLFPLRPFNILTVFFCVKKVELFQISDICRKIHRGNNMCCCTNLTFFSFFFPDILIFRRV